MQHMRIACRSACPAAGGGTRCGRARCATSRRARAWRDQHPQVQGKKTFYEYDGGHPLLAPISLAQGKLGQWPTSGPRSKGRRICPGAKPGGTACRRFPAFPFTR